MTVAIAVFFCALSFSLLLLGKHKAESSLFREASAWTECCGSMPSVCADYLLVYTSVVLLTSAQFLFDLDCRRSELACSSLTLLVHGCRTSTKYWFLQPLFFAVWVAFVLSWLLQNHSSELES